MKKKLYVILENGKFNYANNEELDTEIEEEYGDEGENNMVNMITLEKYYTHTQIGMKGGKTKYFYDYDSFVGKIILFDLCLKGDNHR